MALKVLANAKINWTLDIVGMLPNGYHRLDMLLQSINIADELHFEESSQLTLTIDSLSPITLQNDDNNLVLKAANALRCYANCKNGARIHLKKSIPILAGLGGGSSDAAATLVGLNVLWELQLSSNELTQIGAKLGADIPFCIQGGLQRAEGFGQLLTPLCQLNPVDYNQTNYWFIYKRRICSFRYRIIRQCSKAKQRKGFTGLKGPSI